MKTKFVRQFFNPTFFMQNRTMEYIAEINQFIQLTDNITPNNVYTTQQNTVKYYDNKWFDLSSFSFIPPPSTLQYYSASLNSPGALYNMQEDPEYGVYTYTL